MYTYSATPDIHVAWRSCDTCGLVSNRLSLCNVTPGKYSIHHCCEKQAKVSGHYRNTPPSQICTFTTIGFELIIIIIIIETVIL